MALASLTFTFFLIGACVLFHLLPRRTRPVFLLLASYTFYTSFGLWPLGVLLFVTGTAYVGGKAVASRRTTSTATVVVLLILAPLMAIKYMPALLGTKTPGPLSFGVVVGLSFFSLQAVSYVIDVYRTADDLESRPSRVGLYLSWFPLVTSGPIERGRHLLPQLLAQRSSWQDAYVGFKLLLVGCFFKLTVADSLGSIVDTILAKTATASGASLTGSSVLYSFQIYFDFLGYTTIAIGASRVFGIQLIQNFDRPYLAESLREFWRRWHISLSSWFRDYVYIPLGGSKTQGLVRSGQLMAVFLISGIWHGAGLNFLMWGGTHGAAYLIEERVRQRRQSGRPTWLGRLLGIVVTFSVVTLAWILFRLPVLDEGSLVIAKILAIDRSVSYASLDPIFGGLGTMLALVSLMSALLIDSLTSARRLLVSVPVTGFEIVWELVLVNWLALSLLLFSGGGSRDFIYFQF